MVLLKYKFFQGFDFYICIKDNDSMYGHVATDFLKALFNKFSL